MAVTEDATAWAGPTLGPEETLAGMVDAVRQAGDAALTLQVFANSHKNVLVADGSPWSRKLYMPHLC